ncbi:MAG TPA: hypothetical protein DD435_10345 [Cyanobacteria bacterium UBA8530]|nr:hypothetical protein [Cyanobacteria bacterium UBA8530]
MENESVSSVISTDTARLLLVLASGSLLGILGERLLWEAELGLNLGLLLSCLVMVAWTLLRTRQTPARLLVLPLAFAWAFTWRDSLLLGMADFLALLLALGLVILRPRSGTWQSLGWGEAVRGLAQLSLEVLKGPFKLVQQEIPWQQLKEGGASKHATSVGLGLLISLPLVLLFGALFAGADAGFEALITQFTHFDFFQWLMHLVFAALLAGLSIGFLRAVLRGVEAPEETQGEWSLELVSVATVLIILDLLFALFVGYQLPYLFGGISLVQAAAGLTYADYARRGFIELTAVSILVLPMLLLLRALLKGLAGRGLQVFRLLAGLQLVLLCLIIASALQRMMIYQGEYGLTVLRVYVFAFEVWLFGAIAWFAWTVLGDRRELLIGGMLIWAFGALALMHVPNWEALIVQTNTARAIAGKSLDTEYLNQLGMDAVPALLEAHGRLPMEIRHTMAPILLDRLTTLEQLDWRSASYPRLAAARSLREHRAELEKER